ncbi:MAG: DEAD/DEAH box helicase [Candidatus Saccharimonadales bacterium]
MSYRTQTRRSAPAGRRNTTSYHGGGRQNKKAYIDPRKFVQKAKPIIAEEVFVPQHQFSDFVIDPLLQANLVGKGLVTPTPIQDQAIPIGLNGQDIVGIANTGTGKTIAFALPVLNALLQSPENRVLIMAPTRELAQQIEDECRIVAKGSSLYGALLIGGTPMGPQLSDLRHNPQIVIGTPGRIKDHIERGTLDVAKFNMVVLDEVDRMLDMGFIYDMKTILGQMAKPRQSFFFSATLNPKVKALIDTFSNDPVAISVKTSETSERVEQDVIYSIRGQKLEQLHDVLIREEVSKVLIFDDTKRSVERLSKELQERGFKADAIHGDKSQGQRQRALNRFKRSEVKVLVATDVAARGIDVVDISHVINYSTPQSYEDYVHRVGRAGRAGQQGYALTFIEG